MSRKTTITIITVVLNAADELERTIKSVKSQKALGVEYIVIDGGSSDGSQQVAKDFAPYIDQYVSERDDGISDAFNKGIQISSGDYILILNAGDRLIAGSLHRVLALISREDPPNILYGDVIVESTTGRPLHTERASLERIDDFMTLYHCSMFVSRATYEAVGLYDTNYRLAMDCEFVHRALACEAKFEYAPFSVSSMTLGGLSHRRLGRSLIEFMRSTVRHGRSGALRAGYFAFRQYIYQQALKSERIRAWRVRKRAGR